MITFVNPFVMDAINGRNATDDYCVADPLPPAIVQKLYEAIAQLTETQQYIVTKYFLEEVKLQDIADALNCKATSLSSMLYGTTPTNGIINILRSLLTPRQCSVCGEEYTTKRPSSRNVCQKRKCINLAARKINKNNNFTDK